MAKKFFFAWVDANTAFDPDVHNVEDEDVFAFNLSQVEGDFASLEVMIRNPRVGLLKTGRKVWAWFSMDTGTEIKPLFLGRVVGLPTNLFDTIVTLEFTARPTDFVAQKAALAELLKEPPYYDPIFISPDSWDDPDTVLEGRTVLWHIDPVTHEVTVSDVLVPEDGTIDLAEEDIVYSSMQVTLEQVPLSTCTVTATIPWAQVAAGVVNLTPLLYQFRDPTSDRQPALTSFTMDGLISDWPKDGDSLGEGWSAINSSITDVSMTAGKPFLTEGGVNAPIPEIFDVSNLPPMTRGSLHFPIRVTGEYKSGTGEASINLDYELVGAQLGYAQAELSAQYTRTVDFGQVVQFTMTCDMQKIITLAEEDQTLLLNISANKVTDVTADGSIPLPDARARDYINTARGIQSIEHLVMVARANLVLRSRAVKISFQAIDFVAALDVTLRKGAFIHDHRLPGGEAAGKIVAYSFSLDGDAGEPKAIITMGSSIGYGVAHTPETSDPTYVEVGYVDDPYQYLIHGTTLLPTSDVQYSVQLVEPQDDGLNFQAGISARTAVRQLTITNASWVQRGYMEDAVSVEFGATYGDQSQLSKILQDHPTQFSLLLRSMKQGPFSWINPVDVSTLIIPKQIDLEADSV
jgi:hypothetical protein